MTKSPTVHRIMRKNKYFLTDFNGASSFHFCSLKFKLSRFSGANLFSCEMVTFDVNNLFGETQNKQPPPLENPLYGRIA